MMLSRRVEWRPACRNGSSAAAFGPALHLDVRLCLKIAQAFTGACHFYRLRQFQGLAGRSFIAI
jgi:hypothetical protein